MSCQSPDGQCPNLKITAQTLYDGIPFHRQDMHMSIDEDSTIYKVVVNAEEMYSIWPAERENPPGWQDAGRQGPKAECLAYIQEVWTDMRPLSLRKKMDEAAQQQATGA
jgi:MbtH protein